MRILAAPRREAKRLLRAIERHEPDRGAIAVAFGSHRAHDERHAVPVRRELRVGEETEGVEILRGHRRKKVWHRVVSCHIWDVSRRASELASSSAYSRCSSRWTSLSSSLWS